MSRGIFRKFRVDARGVVAVEFAFIAPILILMYFGIAEFTQAMIVKRRVAHVASTIGDLTARVTNVSTAETTEIFGVARTIITPLATSPLKMRVTSITANAAGAARVDWSDASNWTTLTPGSTVTVPAGVLAANQSVVRADVQYTFDSTLRVVMPNGMTFTQTYYMRPRLSTSVTHNN
jgi:Flp pilus assembly protein TadG